MSKIERQDRDWGARLVVKPFSTKKYANLEIQADVHNPPEGRTIDIWVSFRGTGSEKLRITDARIWRSAMAAIIVEAEKVAEELASKRKKKAARKKAARKKR